MWQKPNTLNESISLVGRPTVAVDEDVLEDILSVIDEDEFDQLDELSKKTLKSYVGKAKKWRSGPDNRVKVADDASDAVRDKARDKAYNRAGQRHLGIQRAVDKMDPDADIKRARRRFMDDRPEPKTRGIKRNMKGFSWGMQDRVRAQMKKEDLDYLADIIESLSDEELGYLNELSKKTLKSYSKKSHKDWDKMNASRAFGDPYNKRKIKNREKGMELAGDKYFAKEDLDHLDYLADVIEDLSDYEAEYLTDLLHEE